MNVAESMKFNPIESPDVGEVEGRPMVAPIEIETPQVLNCDITHLAEGVVAPASQAANQS